MSEANFTQEDISQVLDDVRFFAGKQKMFSKVWCDFYHASEDDKQVFIDTVVEPLLSRYNYPKPMTAEYQAFQKALANLK